MKKDYKHIIFDLDGTITNSEEGITKAAAYALSKFGIKVTDLKKLRPFIGPPLIDGFKTICGFSEPDAILARKFYRDYYLKEGIFQQEVYEGIPKLLEDLKRASKKIYVATSKPHIYTNMILEHFDLLKYFDQIKGAELSELKHDKALYIKEYIESDENYKPDDFIMVGDRMYDIIAARKNNIDSIGVTFGFGNLSELKAHGATFIINSVQELHDFLLS